MFEKGLSSVDLLGIPIILRFARAKRTKSGLGGFWTLVFLAFVFWALYNSGYELFAKEKPKIMDGTIYNRKARTVEVSGQTIPLALSIITDQSSEVDMSSIQCQYEVGFIPNDISSLEWHTMEQCTRSHFNGNFYEIDESPLDLFYCIPKSLQSAPLNSFMLSAMCISADPTALSNWLNVPPIVSLFYPKYGITLQNYDLPTQMYFELHQMAITAGAKLTSWTLTHFNITTDDGWLTSKERTDNFIKVTPTGEAIDFPVENAVQMLYQFTPEREEIFYTRSYTKIQNVLADVGGLAGSLLAILLIVITPYGRIKLSEAFVNEMFEVNEQKKETTKGDRKNLKNSIKTSSKAESTKRDSLQKVEMVERNRKDIVHTFTTQEKSGPAAYLETENNETPYTLHGDDESPLFKPDRKDSRHLQPVQTERTPLPLVIDVVPTSEKENDEDYEEGFRGVKAIILKDQIGRFEPKNPFVKSDDKNETVIEEKQEEQEYKGDLDLENPPSSPALLSGEDEGQKENIQEEAGIQTQAQNENDSDPEQEQEQDATENQSNKLRNDGVFGAIQMAISKRLKKKPKKPTAISISLFEYVTSFVYQSKSTKEKMKMLDEGLKALDYRLDVFNLLKKLRDIDKIKCLIFDKDQQFLFDYLPCPNIMKRRDHWLQEEYLSYHEISKELNAFERLTIKDQIIASKQKVLDKPQKSEFDQKLLNMLTS